MIILGLALLAAGCGGEQETAALPEKPASIAREGQLEAVAVIEAKSGSDVTGTATFIGDGGMVTLMIEIQNAAPGDHAFHIHEIGDCSAEDASSAGGHWNPTGSDHGAWGGEHHHMGDVGNIVVGEDGNGSFQMMSQIWTIGTGEDNDVVGKSVVIHDAVDDFNTQPTGDAGGRIGCGVVQ